MRLLRRAAAGLRALFSRSRLERELDAELCDFLETAIDQKMRAGATTRGGHPRGAARAGQRGRGEGPRA